VTLAPVIVGASRRAGEVRPFVEADIPQVARLHRSVFRPARRDSAGLDAYRAYFMHVFLQNPSGLVALPSLVYQEDDGRITGFLGIVPRLMTMHGKRVQAAIGSQFVADPSSRVGFVAVRLAKAFLEGPQDLSITDEANDTTRRMWEGLGGTTSLLHSMYWTRPLRPAQLVRSWLSKRRTLAPVAAMVAPLTALADTIASRTSSSPFCASAPRGSADVFREDTFLQHVARLAGVGSLRVDYDERAFHWLMDRAGQRKTDGRLHAAIIRNEGAILGWYVFHLDRDRGADVLQIAATSSSIQDVLDHLFHQAGQRGAIAVTGRMEPRFLQALSDNYCFFHRRGPWVLVHARRPELVRCFQNENAFFSRLDGEWCLGF
jgi:hypothetical protein